MRSLWPSSTRSRPIRTPELRRSADRADPASRALPGPQPRGRWAGPSAGACRKPSRLPGAGPAPAPAPALSGRSNIRSGTHNAAAALGPGECCMWLPSCRSGLAAAPRRAGSSRGVHGLRPGRAPGLGAGRPRPGSAGGRGGLVASVGPAGSWAAGHQRRGRRCWLQLAAPQAWGVK